MTGAVLSAGQAAAVLFGVFFVLIVLRVPVAFALGLACLPILLIEPRLSIMMLAQETFNAYNSFILLAVPFFLLTANLMSIGGITDRLVGLSRALVGHWPGSLAQINVVLSVFFAGISGSSTADAASQSKIFIDAQTKEGYDLSFSIAITAVSAVLAVIIPPSILMIVWGGLISTSIGAMYLAGVVPGLLIAGAQMATVHVYAVRRGYPTYPKSSWKEMRWAAWSSLPAMVTPFIIVGGILLGWFTATESACVAVLYSIALSSFVYRETGIKELYKALLDTGRLAGVALFCVGTASAFGWLLAYYRIPHELLANVSTWGMGPIAAGFFIAFCFLVVGCFLDAIPAIVIVGTVRPRDAALWTMLADRLRDCRGATALRTEGHDHHAGADAARARSRHHLAGGVAHPAEADRASHDAVGAGDVSWRPGCGRWPLRLRPGRRCRMWPFRPAGACRLQGRPASTSAGSAQARRRAIPSRQTRAAGSGVEHSRARARRRCRL
jgi:tripartite ATP-independent transporter DctM subunit